MKNSIKMIAATMAASFLFFSCANESPVQKVAEFAENLEQSYENYTAEDWATAEADFNALNESLADAKLSEEEQALLESLIAKIQALLAKSAEEEEEVLDLKAIAAEFAAEAETEAGKEIAKAEDAIPFQAVEEQPSFDGGDANKFSKWVSKNISYPEIAKENGTEGRVILQFVVNAEGAVEDVVVLKGVDPELDAEAVRVVSSSPAWEAGKQNGTPVKVKYTFPVIFTIR